MIKEAFSTDTRSLKEVKLSADLAITGGGLAGTCSAITAARKGLSVVLIQDRPVLGGNSSSEVRLWILGATSHMGNNNRWAREGGVVNELLTENTYRNPEGNPLIWDTILLEKVYEEKNITFLLNTQVFALEKKDERNISRLKAFCSQNSTLYEVHAPLFADMSGDGIVSYLAGAAYRMGSEEPEEFREKFAPDESYGQLLGHTLYFYSKDTGSEVKFVAPSFALKDPANNKKISSVSTADYGCRLWWVEYGGRLDTVHESEKIKWELWRIIYGIWDHIKNSGKYPDAKNLTLEWVGTIPGKRESRRFEGLYMLKQEDIVYQAEHDDAVAFGGWAIDLHPADGVYSDKSSCNQWHSKGIYQIPYRCYVSSDIDNLFYGGRIISASHVAFGSTRVMATCGHGAQAVGMAAYVCKESRSMPKELLDPGLMIRLQNELNMAGQRIPGIPMKNPRSLLNDARINASSTLSLYALPEDGSFYTLDFSIAQMLPLKKGQTLHFGCRAEAVKKTRLEVELRVSSKKGNYTPDVTLSEKVIDLEEGGNTMEIHFDEAVPDDQYAFVCFMKNSQVRLAMSAQRITGILTVFNKFNKAVSNFGKQEPEEDIGVESFEFWTPERRPGGKNLAFTVSPAIRCFGTDKLTDGFTGPVNHPSAWIADFKDDNPHLLIRWEQPQTIRELVLYLDPDYDHPMESVLMGHPERVMPFCVKDIEVWDENGSLVGSMYNNHQAICRFSFEKPFQSRKLKIMLKAQTENVPVSVFELDVF